MVDLNIDLPESFCEEEVRCGYTVSKKMKEVWAVQLDLLDKLLTVCKKHDIQIFASGGTLLGAVRHKGYIPWDDDIDMMMFRDQYEKLCAVAQTEFEFPYFFQTEYSDPGSLRGHAQLRNSQTMGVLESEMELFLGEGFKINQGIFIDIFPLDAVVDDNTLYEKQKKSAEFYLRWARRISSVSTKYNFNQNKGIKGIIKKCMYFILKDAKYPILLEHYFFKKYEQKCKLYNELDTELISPLGLIFEKKHFKCRADFREIIYLPFEVMNIPAPAEYDHALTKFFGNYMEMIQEKSNHGNVIFDTEKSYEQFLEER